MPLYQRTIPSAVLGEYLADLYRFEPATRTRFPETRDRWLAPCKVKGQGLAPFLAEWYAEWVGEEKAKEIAYDYWRVLARRAAARREKERTPNPFRRSVPQKVKAAAPKVEAVKVDKPEAPKRRGRRPGRQSADTLVSDRRLREAMLKAVNANGRVNRGLRRLAKDADMSEGAVRRALKAWEASGQLVRFNYGRGKTQSIRLDRSHPAWSEN